VVAFFECFFGRFEVVVVLGADDHDVGEFGLLEEFVCGGEALKFRVIGDSAHDADAGGLGIGAGDAVVSLGHGGGDFHVCSGAGSAAAGGEGEHF